MRDFVRKPRNWFLMLIVVAIAAALFINLFSSTNANLPSYQAGTEVEPTVTPEPEEPVITFKTAIHTDDEYGFSMPVPAEWSFVVKNGADSYVASNGAMVSFNVGPYDPKMNNVTQESVARDVAALQGLFGGAVWTSMTSYAVIYELGTIDYFEYVTWDLDTLVRVTVSIPATMYADYADQITALFDQFKWEKQNPIPEGYFMYYSDYGNFEFPVPEDWTYGIEDGYFVAVSPDGRTNFRVTVNNTTSDFSGITQLDYVNIMGEGKSGYMLSEYSNSGTVIGSSAAFMNDGVQYIELHQILASGQFQYELLFQSPADTYETVYQTYLQVSNYFRVF